MSLHDDTGLTWADLADLVNFTQRYTAPIPR